MITYENVYTYEDEAEDSATGSRDTAPNAITETQAPATPATSTTAAQPASTLPTTPPATAPSAPKLVKKLVRPTKPAPGCPLPPNDLAPYKPTIFGLDKARRDCRFEMIKIVKEVDAVADDPKIAIDPDRSFQYLSPATFRMLLPVSARLALMNIISI
ncbi:hypothetical protein BOTBODRAFT_121779 [Botryobasidium botryosum FD-172 SS1]|uniref:Uncharacterized protein n=1 Tax=Botryobasidium botryosum (strain FD-172 SS1) TaxID=930990 RepID=A0A067M3W0_BOTB1|nr:hypothetical protein BOTBODRAFT_121779 [Botryobasidium botryosum FD-172 SS1]